MTTQSKPRGRAANTETVALYRFVVNAGRPVTLEEIVAGLPQTMRSHAYREFTADAKSQRLPIKEDGWSDEEKDAAWRWWVVNLLSAAIRDKRIKPNSSDGSRLQGMPTDDPRRIYSPGTLPPMVDVPTTTTKRVPWSPEVDNVSEQVVARMNFLNESEAALNGRPRLPADLRELLELGRRSHGV